MCNHVVVGPTSVGVFFAWSGGTAGWQKLFLCFAQNPILYRCVFSKVWGFGFLRLVGEYCLALCVQVFTFGFYYVGFCLCVVMVEGEAIYLPIFPLPIDCRLASWLRPFTSCPGVHIGQIDKAEPKLEPSRDRNRAPAKAARTETETEFEAVSLL